MPPMPPTLPLSSATSTLAQIQCGSCLQKLPLRLTNGDEYAAAWLCVKCQVPFVACGVAEALLENAELVRLSEQAFDISGQAPISLSERQRAVQLASRPINKTHLDQRRSERISKSLAVPAVQLDSNFTPMGNAFQIMVANLSPEGVGMVHDQPIEAEHLCLEFSPTSQSPIQILVRLVRQRELTPPYNELGGLFLTRLGNLTAS